MPAQPTSYFDNVQRAFVKAGFVLISRVVTDTTTRTYHVPVTFARCTTFFWHIRGKAVIARCCFNESDYREQGSVDGYWSFRIERQFLPYRILFDMTYDADHSEWDDRYRPVPGKDIGLEIPSGFVQYSMDLGQNTWRGKPVLAPNEFAQAIRTMVDPMLPYLCRRFGELQVTSFPPHYVFPDCEEEFWGKFDLRYFRHLVRKPWGSDALKRRQTV